LFEHEILRQMKIRNVHMEIVHVNESSKKNSGATSCVPFSFASTSVSIRRLWSYRRILVLPSDTYCICVTPYFPSAASLYFIADVVVLGIDLVLLVLAVEVVVITVDAVADFADAASVCSNASTITNASDD
jgi:hypothetical protein